MTETASQNTNLPKWARILALLLIPLLVAIITNFSSFKDLLGIKEIPKGVECPEAFTIVGRAYYQDGTSVIVNTPISLIDLTHNQEVTASDGTFSFEQVKLDCEREFLQLGLEVEGKLITARRRFDLTKGQAVIDFNQVIFPVKKKDSSVRPPIEDPEEDKYPPSLPVKSPEKKEVLLKYPDKVKNPEILYEDEDIEVVSYGITNCKLMVPEGEHRITLLVQDEEWVTTIANEDSVITPTQFTKTQ